MESEHGSRCRLFPRELRVSRSWRHCSFFTSQSLASECKPVTLEVALGSEVRQRIPSMLHPAISGRLRWSRLHRYPHLQGLTRRFHREEIVGLYRHNTV